MATATEPLLISLEETARLLKISRGKAYSRPRRASCLSFAWAARFESVATSSSNGSTPARTGDPERTRLVR
jgi:hypothetical protein